MTKKIECNFSFRIAFQGQLLSFWAATIFGRMKEFFPNSIGIKNVDILFAGRWDVIQYDKKNRVQFFIQNCVSRTASFFLGRHNIWKDERILPELHWDQKC